MTEEKPQGEDSSFKSWVRFRMRDVMLTKQRHVVDPGKQNGGRKVKRVRPCLVVGSEKNHHGSRVLGAPTPEGRVAKYLPRAIDVLASHDAAPTEDRVCIFSGEIWIWR